MMIMIKFLLLGVFFWLCGVCDEQPEEMDCVEAKERKLELLKVGLDGCSQKQTILRSHNKLRNEVASGKSGRSAAENMIELTWSREAERVAENWAAKCINEHNPKRSFDDGRKINDNIYLVQFKSDILETETDQDIFKSNIDNWFLDEIDLTTMAPGAYDEMTKAHDVDDTSLGHYSQAVWATTRQVGCSYSYFLSKGRRPERKRWNFLFVCNYVPPGNVAETKDPYVHGDKNCQKHFLKDSFNFDFLCESHRPYTDEDDPCFPKPRVNRRRFTPEVPSTGSGATARTITIAVVYSSIFINNIN